MIYKYGQIICTHNVRYNKFIIKNKAKDLKLKNDQTKLRQILFNMLSNAAKFTKKGKITLQVDIEMKTKIKFDIIDK